MLGRVANGMFWLYRYLERAENTARLLEAGQRMAITRGAETARREWGSILTTLNLRDAYESRHSDYSSAHVCDFVLRSKDNPQSVLSMLESARTNARLSRSTITAEIWEAINDGWMTLSDLLSKPVRENSMNMALGAIRQKSTLVRGATHGSMLRNEAYSFARLGTFVERADNTARILDVKYYLLLPSVSYVGTPLDTGQWENVLRSLSGERAYRWLNAGRMDARSIADFLILDERFPRSLAFCYCVIRENLAELAQLHGGETEAHALTREADLRMTGYSVEQIFDQGLHEFITEFLSTNRTIADCIATDYRFTV